MAVTTNFGRLANSRDWNALYVVDDDLIEENLGIVATCAYVAGKGLTVKQGPALPTPRPALDDLELRKNGNTAVLFRRRLMQPSVILASVSTGANRGDVMRLAWLSGRRKKLPSRGHLPSLHLLRARSCCRIFALTLAYFTTQNLLRAPHNLAGTCLKHAARMFPTLACIALRKPPPNFVRTLSSQSETSPKMDKTSTKTSSEKARELVICPQIV